MIAHKKRLSIYLLSMLAVAGVILSSAGQVYAAPLGSSTPYGPNTDPDNAAVFFLRKQQNAGVQTDIKYSIFMPTTANIGNARFQLSPGTAALSESRVCEANPSPGDNSRYIRVTIADAANPGNNRFYFISRANVCAEANQLNNPGNNPAGNVLFARYAFPNTPASAESKTGLYKFDVTVEYGPGILTGLPSAGAIRVYATVPTNGTAILSPGTGGFAFPTVGDWELVDDFVNRRPGFISNYNHTIPFGMCNPSNTPINRTISLYDADNGPGSSFNPLVVRFKVYDLTTGSYVNFGNYQNSVPLEGGTAVRPSDGTTNGSASSADFALIPSHFYEMRIYQIHLQNTIDVQLPAGSESAWGVPGVCSPTIIPIPPTRESVTVQPRITSGADVEVGDPATFTQGTEVTNFPTMTEWGYTESATQNAYATNIAAVQKNYSAQMGAESSLNSNEQIQCADGVYRMPASCADLGRYDCVTGGNKDSCGAGNAYNWHCTKTSGPNSGNRVNYNSDTGGATNKPANCNDTEVKCADGGFRNNFAGCVDLGTYQCKDNDDQDSCGEYKWQCTYAGEIREVNDPANTRAGMDANKCRVFNYYCKNSSGNWKSGGNEDYVHFKNKEDTPGCSNKYDCPAPSDKITFDASEVNGNYCKLFRCAVASDAANPFFDNNGNPDVRCDFRCLNGAGSHAPLALSSNKYGDGDLYCYIAPSFSIRCIWDTGAVTANQTVTGDGTYCTGQANTTITKTSGTPGQVCATTTAQVMSGWTNPPPGMGNGNNYGAPRATWDVIALSDSDCSNVVSKPYFRVYNGDVNATAMMPDATGTCNLSAPSGPIKVFNRGNSVRTDGVQEQYRGAGGQIAALSGATITGFASRATAINSPFVPKVLTFSNSGSGAANSEYGGGYTGPRYCIPNYWAEAAVSGIAVPGLISSNPMATPPASGTLVQYVNGDAYITTNINYGDGSYAANLFPAYRLVVTGNIYIANTVTRLDGAYIARGTIYTCADAASPPSISLVADSCGNQLLVNGGFVANLVKLLRTTTSMRASNVNQQRATDSQAAEKFVFSPESWLRTFTPIGPDSQPDSYDAVNTLPPIL